MRLFDRISEPEQRDLAPADGFYTLGCKEPRMFEQDTLPPFPCQDGVEFRHIAGALGYCVGSDGSVWSCRKAKVPAGQYRVGAVTVITDQWRKLRPWGGGTDLRPHVTINRKSQRVHRLVLEAFIGPCPKGMVAVHKDGDCHNNRLSNLRWGTPKENGEDAVRHGRSSRGVKNPNAKLTEEKVRTIRILSGQGKTQKEIASILGVDSSNVCRVLTGYIWGWLS